MDKSVQDLIVKGLGGKALTTLVDGWSFRVAEVSSNVYKIDGMDTWGHKISNVGTDPEEVLNRSLKDANRILSRREFINKIRAAISKIFRS